MDLSYEALRPHLEAFAYLVEILLAEGLFLRHFEKRERYRLRSSIPLAAMFLLATVIGIPSGSSLARFLWYFLFMSWRVLCTMACFRGDFIALASACMAGFATQHIANKITLLFRLIPGAGAALERTPALGIPLEVLVFAGVYAWVYVVFARKIRFWSENPNLNFFSVAIIFLCIGVNRLVVDTSSQSARYEAAVCIYAITGCLFALIILVYISRWEEERSQARVMARLLADSEKQYEKWKTNVELTRVAVHDIRHMLDRVEALAGNKHIDLPDLEAVRRTMDGFAPAVRTGSEELDVLLRNMTDLCSQNGITLNCAAYTNYLRHFDGMSLYFLFANAIDNAMESAALVTEPDKRLIDVSIRRFGRSVVIHIWNYYTGKLDFADGLPITKNDRQIHGFGMKSIRFIVDRFGGVLNVRAENGVFNLDILLPLEASEADAPDDQGTWQHQADPGGGIQGEAGVPAAPAGVRSGQTTSGVPDGTQGQHHHL